MAARMRSTASPVQPHYLSISAHHAARYLGRSTATGGLARRLTFIVEYDELCFAVTVHCFSERALLQV